MLDIGVTKLAIIGGIALLVIGPEKLPGLAKTAGTLLGRARRYVADVKAEVSRSMELDELKKMRASMESAVQDVQTSVQTSASEFESAWAETSQNTDASAAAVTAPVYRHPKKKWRLKQGATPRWYKVRTGARTNAQSGAARVARFRPPKVSR